MHFKERLLQAALEEFAFFGFEGASVDQIARKARCPPTTLYRNFGSKAGLFNALYRLKRAQLDSWLGQFLEPGLPAREQFHKLWTALIGTAESSADEIVFLEGHIHYPFLDHESLTVPVTPPAIEATVAYALRELGADESTAGPRADLIWGGFVQLLKRAWAAREDVSIRLAIAEDLFWQVATQPARARGDPSGANVRSEVLHSGAETDPFWIG